MSNVNDFWKHFKEKDFSITRESFLQLTNEEQELIFAELFQKSEYHRMPVMISVLRGELHKNASFDDFYESWLPSEDMCNKVELQGQVFQQHFPVPTRVINAVNINNSEDIMSVGLTWVSNKEEEQGLWDYLKKATDGEDKNNETRRERAAEVIDRDLLGLFQVETDDNLGTPF